MRHLAAMSVGALLLLVVTVVWYLGLLARSDRAQQAAVVMVFPSPITLMIYVSYIVTQGTPAAPGFDDFYSSGNPFFSEPGSESRITNPHDLGR
jgi:hypothetical protein